MPVKIPRLQQIQESATLPKNERINIRAQDRSANLLKQSGQVTSLVDKGFDLHKQYEEKKTNLLAQEDELEASAWDAQASQEAKMKTDIDPTITYAEMDKKREEFYKSILNKRSDLSGNVKRGLEARLQKVKDRNIIGINKQRGAQQATYTSKVNANTLKIRKNLMAETTDDLTPHIDGIKTQVARNALTTTGGATLTPKGGKPDYEFVGDDNEIVKINWTPLGKAKAYATINEGIKGNIDALIDSGKKEEAKAVFDKYKKEYLEPEYEATFTKKYETQGINDDAAKQYYRLENMSYSQRKAELRKMSAPVRLKVEDRLYTKSKRMEADKKRRQEMNAEIANKEYNKMKRAGQVHGASDILNNPVMAKVWSRMSEDDKEAILKDIENPKTSTPKAVTTMLEFFNGNHPEYKPETITDDQFRKLQANLDPKARRESTERLAQLRSKTGNGKEEYGIWKKINADIKSRMIVKNWLSIDSTDKKVKADDLRLLNAAYNYVQTQDFNPSMSNKERGEFADKMLNDMIKYKVFKKEIPWYKINAFSKPTITLNEDYKPVVRTKKKIPTKNPFIEMPIAEFQKVQDAYYEKTGTIAKSTDQGMINFYYENAGTK